MTAIHGLTITTIKLELTPKSMYVMNTVIDPHADDDGRNSDRHNVQWDAGQTHYAQHQTRSENVWRKTE